MLDFSSRLGYSFFACGIFPLLVLPALAQNQQDRDLEEIELTVTEKLLRLRNGGMLLYRMEPVLPTRSRGKRLSNRGQERRRKP